MINLLEASCHSVIGNVRSNNEDNFYFSNYYLDSKNTGLLTAVSYKRILKSGTTLAVFDGMGGGDFGEIAAYEAAKKMDSILKQPMSDETPHNILTNLCLSMNQAVFDKEKEFNNFRMGSTVAGLQFNNEYAYSFNLGDSKVFCLRDNQFMQISSDHTDEKYLKEKGITNRRPSLTQHLGIDPYDLILEPYITKIKYKRGDYYLICSDGLTDMLTNFEISEIILTCGSVENCTNKLIQKTLDKGGKDNITVILCKIH